MKKSNVEKVIKRKGKQPFFAFVKSIIKLILHRPKKIINLNETIEDHAVFLSNHFAKLGPIYLELYLPKKHAVWGAHEMLGNYKSRFKYLRDIFYIKKRGYNKFIATISASFEAFFSILFYRGMRVMPTYEDIRMAATINDSIKVIDSGLPVLIFPENSDEGYKEQITSCHPGCHMLADRYYRTKGKDVPVYPIYVQPKMKAIAIGKPMYLQEMKNKGMSKEDILEEYRNQINGLFVNYIQNREK